MPLKGPDMSTPTSPRPTPRPTRGAMAPAPARDPRATSPRPQPRPQRMSAREMALAAAYDEMRQTTDRVNQGAGEPNRAHERDMMRQFGNLELRADMDPYLANDALARLGFDPNEIRYFSPYNKVSALHTENPMDLRLQGLSRDTLLAYRDMYPDLDYTVPDNSILMTPFYPPAALAHESRHRGVELLRRDPEANLADPYFQEVPFGEEAVMEVGDLPYLDETQNNPRGTFVFDADRTPFTVRSSIQRGMPAPGSAEAIARRRTFDELQEAARAALERRGEVPRATMQGDVESAVQGMQGIRRDFAPDRGEQESGSVFGGIGRLFGRIFGR